MPKLYSLLLRLTQIRVIQTGGGVYVERRRVLMCVAELIGGEDGRRH
jgi:hypothetical protein